MKNRNEKPYNFIWRTEAKDWPVMTRQSLITTHNGREIVVAELSLEAPTIGKDFHLIPRIIFANCLPKTEYIIEADSWSEAKEKAKALLKEHIKEFTALVSELSQSL